MNNIKPIASFNATIHRVNNTTAGGFRIQFNVPEEDAPAAAILLGKSNRILKVFVIEEDQNNA